MMVEASVRALAARWASEKAERLARASATASVAALERVSAAARGLALAANLELASVAGKEPGWVPGLARALEEEMARALAAMWELVLVAALGQVSAEGKVLGSA